VTLGMDELTEPGDYVVVLQIVFLLTVLTMAPAILLMMTSFTRILVVLGFMRQAMGTQQMPPNQVLISLALFLTFFVMSPVIKQVNDEALQPFLAKEITQDEALQKGLGPIRGFMLRSTREKDLKLFYEMSGNQRPKTLEDVPTHVLIPAFMISELKTAFQIGFMIYVPFLILDMVVASVLLAMGMLMLPPILVSLPFKLMLFVLVDGWNLVVGSLVRSFGP